MVVQQALEQVPFFSQLPAAQITELAQMGRNVSLAAGEIVCHEGELSDSMYVLLGGKVTVYRHDKAGKRVDLRQFGAGDYFGEVALLDSKPRTATVACLTACELFVLEQAVFREVLTANPSLIFSVLVAVADRVRERIEQHYQVELENQALEAQAEIERHRSIAQMVAGVAHELNTPLGITNTAVDMIVKRINRPEIAALFEQSSQSKKVLDNIQEATSLAQRNIARAHKLIQEFKKISVNQVVDTLQQEDLPELVACTVDLFTINARQARLTIEIDNQLPAGRQTWLGYPGYLTQVLLNLLTNVERYAYEPGSGGKVDIILTADYLHPTPTFTLTVRDFGQGIAPENLDRVFEPFFTTGRTKGGTGLGLAIVHNIVTAALQGEIGLSSKPGEGTAFTITFPQTLT
ncbi:MAG: cyclic nucleotide-binding domain-containing protein [Chloroflexi bacterium]|nr:cyclic nucleotide-binding domain-containing protein [Chloroflexota bacterium]MCI0645442.1 cyclic nucleotide-binding domain-containing protein [Chloroflexota bacterium]